MSDTATREVFPESSSLRVHLVVAPCSGRFLPLPPESFTTEGEWVDPGQQVAVISDGPNEVPVTSAFRGWVMGMLAIDGQPVHKGEALFWIRGC